MKNLDEKQLKQLRDAEQAANDNAVRERLSNRFDNQNKPFIIKNARKRTISLILSYVFNIVSALGIMYVVVVQLEALPQALRWSIAIGTLIGFELLKRYFSDEFWDEYHSTGNFNYKTAAINFILLFGLSLGGTAFGLFFVSKDTDPGAAALRMQIDEITSEIKDHTTNKNSKGEIYWLSQQALKGLYKDREELNAQLATASTTLPDQHQTTAYWQQKSEFRAWSLVVLAILFEIFFEVCMSFMSKYDYRKFIAVKMATSSPAQPDNDKDALIDKLNKKLEQMNEQVEIMKLQLSSGTNINQLTGTKNNGKHPPTVNQHQPMGFHNHKLPENIVATGGHQVTTDEIKQSNTDYSLEIDRLIRAYSSAKSEHSKWSAKLRNGQGRDETNKRHMKNLENEMAEIDADIKKLKAA